MTGDSISAVRSTTKGSNMLGDIKTVAHGTFDRYFKMKELYVIIILCVIDVMILGRYDELTLKAGREFMIDGALAVLTVVGLITSMAVVFEKSRELREKTAHFIITKPSGRSSYIWGKFLGISCLSIFNIGLITLGSLLMFKMSSLDRMDVNVFANDFMIAAALIVAESIVLAAVGLFLSMFLPDTLTVLMVVVVFVLGHSLYMLPRYFQDSPGLWVWVSNIFPNFNNLDVKSEVSASIAVSTDMLWYGLGYAALYAVALVAAAAVIFNRKDIA